MDKEIKKIMDRLESAGIGLDEEFKFHCTMCGKCCIHREDIFLNPRDIYNMSKELKITPQKLVEQYCEVYVGDDSRVPIVRLRLRGNVQRCPLLKNRKCMVHNAKPAVCAMFPVGRYVVTEDGEAATGISAGRIRYMFTDPECGDNTETHTVREWLEDFGIPAEDGFFRKWQEILVNLAKSIRKIETVAGGEVMETVWTAVFAGVYLNYETEKDFMIQFEGNVTVVLSMLHEIIAEEGGNGGGDGNDSI